MPGKKRKASDTEFTCGCFKAHKTEHECEKQALLDERQELAEKHRGITARDAVEIFAGEQEKQSFIVHSDLLALHSTYFSDLFSEEGRDVDKKIEVSARPSLFADFVSWIYSGEFLNVKNGVLDGGTTVDDLWELGRFFVAPAFQNFCMDDCRKYCKASETDRKQPWPFVEGIKQMYCITPRGSLLRSLAVDSLSYKNPLQEKKKGSGVWKEWNSLLTGQASEEAWIRDLREDFALEVGKNWNGIPPWDDQHRKKYMEKETSLEERWDAQILAARTKADIKEAALAKTDVRSMIEWAHLQRGEE